MKILDELKNAVSVFADFDPLGEDAKLVDRAIDKAFELGMDAGKSVANKADDIVKSLNYYDSYWVVQLSDGSFLGEKSHYGYSLSQKNKGEYEIIKARRFHALEHAMNSMNKHGIDGFAKKVTITLTNE